jgi:hypothetical protein
VNKNTTLSCGNFGFEENSDAGRVVLASAKRLRTKLNHAVEATDVKLAASKTALGLHCFSSLLEIVQTTIETCKKDIHRSFESHLDCD